MSEKRLMKIKRDIERTEKDIHKNEGKLSSLFDTLKDSLNLPPETADKAVLKEADKRVSELKESLKKDEKRLEVLMTEIEEEVRQWAD